MRTLFFLFFSFFSFQLLAQNASKTADSLRIVINRTAFPEKSKVLDAFYNMDDVWVFEEDEMRWVNEGLDFYKKPKTIEETERYFTFLKMRSYYFSRLSDYENMTNDVVDIQKGISKIVEPSKLLLGIKAKTNLFMAQNSFARGEVEESIANINDAIEVFKFLKDTYNIAQSIKGLGGRYSSLKEYDKALSLGEEALQLFRRLGDEVEVLRTQNTIASIYLDAERWEDALQVLLASVPKMEIINHPSLGYTLTDIAWSASKLGDFQTGQTYIEKAKPYIEASGNKHMKLIFYETAAEVEEGANELESALDYQKKLRALQLEQGQNLMKATQIESDANLELDEKIVELEKRIEQEKQSTLEKILLAILASAIFSALSFFFFYKKKKKEYKAILAKTQAILDEKLNGPEQTKEITLVWDEAESIRRNAGQVEDADLFLKFFTAKVQKQLSDPDLTVERLAEQMKMSRVALFNRVKAATNGNAPSTLIRIIRLETARRILESEKITVAEVADRVGFKNPNNFSRAFKKQFGISPSEV